MVSLYMVTAEADLRKKALPAARGGAQSSRQNFGQRLTPLKFASRKSEKKEKKKPASEQKRETFMEDYGGFKEIDLIIATKLRLFFLPRKIGPKG